MRGSTMSERVARVLVPQAGKCLFDYRVPDMHPMYRGQLVRVPLGRRRVLGVVWACDPEPEVPPERLKPIAEWWDDWPPLDPVLLDQIAFASDYYLNPLGEYLAFVLPPALRRRKRQVALAAVTDGAVGEHATGESTASQRRSEPVVTTPGPRLTAAQARAYAQLTAGPTGFDPVLLFGVTGSGKTECYLRLIAETLAAGRQALVLVPEIGLVPQTTTRVVARFPGARIGVWHSDLNARERQRLFAALVQGAVDCLIGTRSAIFAPMPRLGLILVDEEHDASYRQFEGAPYSARDLALWRGKAAQVRVVLGSATPSLERWWDSERGRIRRVTLAERATGVPLPTIELLPVTREAPRTAGLVPEAWEALKETLARGEQALLFLNRRGFAPTLYCAHCGWVQECRRCSVRMVYHRVDSRMRCHHCGWSIAVPEVCPTCGNGGLSVAGQGTQRLEAELHAAFADHGVVRIDRDACQTAAAFAALRKTVARADAKLLIGTQMIAKGHDFPALSLVIVVGADAGLLAAETRATERLMQQLLQVAGRAGRSGQPGRVLVQTRYPDHPFYQQLVAHDYAAFANTLLTERKRLALPPFVHQALLRADAPRLEVALEFLTSAKATGEAMREQHAHGHAVRLLDVVPLRIVRLAGRERAQLVVESPNRAALHTFLRAWRERLLQWPQRQGLRWRLEVDPLDT
ncbi:primosomal protein N' [Hydrogenophilus hirschii]